jgi:hypothetical protein
MVMDSTRWHACMPQRRRAPQQLGVVGKGERRAPLQLVAQEDAAQQRAVEAHIQQRQLPLRARAAPLLQRMARRARTPAQVPAHALSSERVQRANPQRTPTR